MAEVTQHFFSCPAFSLPSLPCWPLHAGKHPEVPAHRIAYTQWGDPKGVPVMCVHGLTRNGRDFDFLAGHLADAGYCVVCPDIVGRGQSDFLADPALYGYPLYVADMDHLLAHLGWQEVHWVGTSMGGLIGMFLEAWHPGAIKTLVLNDIGPFIPAASLRRIGEHIAYPYAFDSYKEAEASIHTAMATFGIKQAQHWEHVITHMLVEEEDGGFHLAYDPHLADAFRNKRGALRKMHDMEMWPLWDMLSCPTLVVRGEESDLLLAQTAEKMAQRSEVEVVTIPDVGHAPMLMNKKEINIIIQYLKKYT